MIDKLIQNAVDRQTESIVAEAIRKIEENDFTEEELQCIEEQKELEANSTWLTRLWSTIKFEVTYAYNYHIRFRNLGKHG